jgi:hypothetical protein
VVAVTAATAGTKGVVGVAGIAGTAATVVKKPHPLAQTCQSTPALVVSLVTAALRLTTAYPGNCDGADGTKLIDTFVDGVMVMAGVE